MTNFKFFLLLLAILVTASQATYVAVLETSADASAKEGVSLSDRQYLTNVLREQAVKELPAVQNYTIMTRENIQQMLPPGKAIEDCEGSCLVETGKNIAADFICQARVVFRRKFPRRRPPPRVVPEEAEGRRRLDRSSCSAMSLSYSSPTAWASSGPRYRMARLPSALFL